MTTLFTLDLDHQEQFADVLQSETWIVACLCAQWCDVCTAYRPDFNALAARHPDKTFIWIDIEDQADLVGDFDIENFPTLLIQRGDTVAFFGTMQPNTAQLDRMLKTFTTTSHSSSVDDHHRNWQDHNLRTRLKLAKASTPNK